MLDEKKVMTDKLLSMTLLTIAAGFLLGVGLFLVGAAFVTKEPGIGLIGGLIIIITSLIGHLGDRIKNQIADYIKQPYVKMEVSDGKSEDKKVS